MDREPNPDRRRLHVVLVAPEIPWNTGNVGRTCLAAGARLHLVRPLGFSLDARRLRRAGLDYWQHVSPEVWPSWRAFEDALPRLGEPFFFSSEGTQDFWSVDYPDRTVLIFGSETAGLADDIRRQHRQRLLAIPMGGDRVATGPPQADRVATGPVRSLNLSTAAAIAIYEVRRQWRSARRS